MAKSRLALGLDIGSSSVKLVQLKEAKRGYILEAFGVAALPPEAIVDGALMNSTAIVEAIRGLVAQYKLKNREAAIGVSGLIASLVAGQLWDRVGHAAVFWTGAAFAAAAAVAALTLIPASAHPGRR